MLNVDQLFVSYKDPDADDEILEGTDMALFLVNYLESQPQKRKKGGSALHENIAAGTLRKSQSQIKPSARLSRKDSVLTSAELESSSYKQASASYMVLRCIDELMPLLYANHPRLHADHNAK